MTPDPGLYLGQINPPIRLRPMPFDRAFQRFSEDVGQPSRCLGQKDIGIHKPAIRAEYQHPCILRGEKRIMRC